MQKKVKITVAPLWGCVVIVACRQNQQGEINENQKAI
jgi:hypothetical protein